MLIYSIEHFAAKISSKLFPETLDKRIRISYCKKISPLKGLILDEKRTEVKKTIVILGMRSGTSLVSNIVTNMGINLGKELLGAGKGNEKGHFENKRFIRMNDKLLSVAGGTWDFPPNPAAIKKLKSDERLMKEVCQLVRSQEDCLWGWKDPRTVFTIELYLSIIKNPNFIICRRDPLSVAKSLNKRDNIKIEKGLSIAKKYAKRLDQFISENNFPAIQLFFEEFFSEPENQILKIKNFLEIETDIMSEIINNGLRHF